MGDGAKSEDFNVIKYGHDRAHELELNKFAHALEVEQLKLLILLNGAAATALLTFAEHGSLQASIWWFATAIGCWILGLALGAYAIIKMQFVQTKFAQSLRHRRCAEEWRQLGAKDNSSDFIGRLGLPGKELRIEIKEIPVEMKVSLPEFLSWEEGAWLNDMAAEHLLKGGGAGDVKIRDLSIASVGFFVLGALAATFAIVSQPTSGEGPSTAVQNSAASR